MTEGLRRAALVGLVEGAKNIGKIQMQKLVYFLQEAGVPLDYAYEIYHYGPFSQELSNDVDTLDSLDILSVETDVEGYGFHINPGRFAAGQKLQKGYAPALQRVLKCFGKDTPSELEVKATVHFVNSVLRQRGRARDEQVIEKVKALKPRFSERFIKVCLQDLRTNRWL